MGFTPLAIIALLALRTAQKLASGRVYELAARQGRWRRVQVPRDQRIHGRPLSLCLVVRCGFGLEGEGRSSSSAFGDDVLGWFSPHDGCGSVFQCEVHVSIASTRAATLMSVEFVSRRRGELRKLVLDQVHPRRRRQGEEQVPTSPCRMHQSFLHRWRVVGRHVAQHDNARPAPSAHGDRSTTRAPTHRPRCGVCGSDVTPRRSRC